MTNDHPAHAIARPASRTCFSAPCAVNADGETAANDDRWATVAAALADLREAGRFSVRIVDADCGSGDLLLRAVRHARQLGFTAIEARGIDLVAALVAQGQSAAAALDDPAIGVSFETGDPVTALAVEFEFPADIVLWCGKCGCRSRVAKALAAAGRQIIVSPHIALKTRLAA